MSNEKLQKKIDKRETFYVSITGLTLNKPWYIFNFIRRAVPSFNQSKAAKGNLMTSAKNIKGIRHTLTVWESKKAMQAYIYTGAHLKAIQIFKKFFKGRTYGYESSTVPSWDEVVQIYWEKGRKY